LETFKFEIMAMIPDDLDFEPREYSIAVATLHQFGRVQCVIVTTDALLSTRAA
jgi:hypothetical protein